MKTAEEELAQYIVQTNYDALPKSVVQSAKRDILDTIGTTLGGSGAPGCKEVVELAREFGGKTESSILVYGGRLPAPLAALANGTMAHALDFDDTHDESVLHAGVTVIPAALAIAERLGGVSGKEFITAVALGVDVVCRMGLATKIWIGWLLTPVYGYFGAAMAAGKLLKLEENAILDAMGIAYAQSAGNIECVASGALTKRVQVGFAARGGVVSALMAQRGITGVRNSLTAKAGLFNLYQRGKCDPHQLTAELGERFEISNLSYKPYPCCRWLHTPIDAALAMQKEHEFNPRDITKIEIQVGEKAWQSVGEPQTFKLRPRNIVDAQFSIPYAVAVALVKGKVQIGDFTPTAIKREEILSISTKAEMKVDHNMEKKVEGGISPAIVTVHTRDGKTRVTKANVPLGHPQNPMSETEFRDKFMECATHASRRLPRAATRRALTMLGKLEDIENVSDVISLLAPRPSR